jgi:hypothetical protein
VSALLYLDPRGQMVRSELPDVQVLLQAPIQGRLEPLLVPVTGDSSLSADLRNLAQIVPWRQDGRLRHAHFALGTVYRNTEPVPLDEFVVLQDRDALAYRVAGQIHRFFYDSFTRAEPRLHEGQATECPFCRQRVAHGDLVMPCPVCATVYHHAAQSSCWLASEQCPVCGRPTAIEVPSWVPAGFTCRQTDDPRAWGAES